MAYDLRPFVEALAVEEAGGAPRLRMRLRHDPEKGIGRPDEVKRILMDSAGDLGRERTFQGSGLVDAMRAIQSV